MDNKNPYGNNNDSNLENSDKQQKQKYSFSFKRRDNLIRIFDKKDVIIGILLLTMVLLGAIIIYVANKNTLYNDTIQTISNGTVNLVSKKEEITLRNLRVMAIKNFEDGKSNKVTEGEANKIITDIIIKDSNGKIINLIDISKESINNNFYFIDGSKYKVGLENNKLIFSKTAYEKPYVLRLEGQKVVVYKIDASGEEKRYRDSEVSIQGRKDVDLSFFKAGMAQIDSSTDDAIRNYLHVYIS